LFKLLWNLPNTAAHDLTGYLTLALQGSFETTPLLTDIIVEDQTVALTATQEQQVSAILGAGAKTHRTAMVARQPTPVSSPEGSVAPPAAGRRDWGGIPAKEPEPRRSLAGKGRSHLAGGLGVAAVLLVIGTAIVLSGNRNEKQ